MVDRVFGQGFHHRVAVYVPGTTAVREALTKETAERYVLRVQRSMAKRFGGATAFSASGGWVSQSGYLVTEQVTIVYSFSESLSTGDLIFIKKLATYLKRELRQEAVAVEIDGELVFVS